MKSAVVYSFDHPPRYQDFPDPVAGAGQVIVKVGASALSRLTRSRAAGKHYSSGNTLNFVPGVDGVGRLEDGSRVYFLFPAWPYGAMGELTLVDRKSCVLIPDNVDDVTMAGLGIPAMSSWVALMERARFKAGETVLINGATGSSGRLAVQIAKYLGAGKVIATGRNQESLNLLPALGADAVISLKQPVEELGKALADQIKRGVDVVLDYLWGESAEQIISAVSGSGTHDAAPRVRFVQIGAMASPTIKLSAAALRSSGLEILGSGFGSVSAQTVLKAIADVAQVAVAAKLRVETEAAPLSQIERTWNDESGRERIVYTVG